MITRIKYHLKSFLPVKADIPGNSKDNGSPRTFVTLSLKRSGQHAVINWLCTQARDIVHFNHCNFERRNACYWITASTNRVVQYKGSEKFDNGVQQRDDLIQLLSRIDNYKQLLYSFEDFDVEHKQLRKYILKESPTVVIIIRDPYNWLASTLKRKDCDYEQLVKKKRVLIKHLEYALHLKKYPGYPLIFINYNKWVTDQEYRKEICRLLAIPFSDSLDKAILEVPDFGGGSSFSGARTITEKFSSNVFYRWKEFISDSLYRELLDDNYLAELSRSFFETDSPL